MAGFGRYFSAMIRRLWVFYFRHQFKSCGVDVTFFPGDIFSWSTISLGSHIFIGPGAIFSASESGICIGNKVMFGPRVTIMGGDHNAAELGEYMFDVKIKRSGNDLPVFVEDDVWIGAGAIILKGVTIGRGSIVAAGSVVTKSVPPYSIAAGNPARVLKQRFEPEVLKEHIRIINQKLGVSG